MGKWKNSDWNLEPPVATMENIDRVFWYVDDDGFTTEGSIDEIKPGQPWMYAEMPDPYVPGKADDDAITKMLEVLRELQECSEYWSEYFVPLGIHQRIANAIKAGEEL